MKIKIEMEKVHFQVSEEYQLGFMPNTREKRFKYFVTTIVIL